MERPGAQTRARAGRHHHAHLSVLEFDFDLGGAGYDLVHASHDRRLRHLQLLKTQSPDQAVDILRIPAVREADACV